MQRSAATTTAPRRLGAIAIAALACAGAGAAELGEVALRSYIGQPLVADIELGALAPDEVAGLQVRLASPDVYRGANIGMHPALQTVQISIVRREQRQYLHITSQRRIDADYLHLYLEMSAGGRSAVRAATLWLTPDPTPAPAPALPAAAPAAAAAPEAAPSAALIAARARAAMAHPPATVPAATPAKALPGHAAPVRSAAMPAPIAKPQRAAASCAPGSAGEAKVCLALDQKNAALTRKLVELEGKIKVLQQELLPAQGAPAAPPVRALPTVKPKPKALGAAAAAKKTPPADSTPVALWAGAAVAALLLIGLASYLYLRRKKAAAPSEPSKYWVLLRKPFRRKKALEEVEAPAVEPALE
jgi:hypothetical protein